MAGTGSGEKVRLGMWSKNITVRDILVNSFSPHFSVFDLPSSVLSVP